MLLKIALNAMKTKFTKKNSNLGAAQVGRRRARLGRFTKKESLYKQLDNQ